MEGWFLAHLEQKEHAVIVTFSVMSAIVNIQ